MRLMRQRRGMTITDSVDAPTGARLRAGRSVDQNALAPRVAPKIRAERVERLERVVAERVRRRRAEVNDRIAVLNHELRTPLSLVIGYSEMLLGGMAGDLTGEQARMLRRVEEGGQRLHDLVQELLRITVEPAERGEVVDVASEILRVLGDAEAQASGCPDAAAPNGVPTLGR